MAKEFVYTQVKELGKVNNATVEVGYYTVDGKQMPDKVYMVTHFTRKNGVEDSKATAICNVTDVKEIAKLLMNI